MVERVAVLLGTVQFRLKVKGNVPKSTTLVDAEKAAWAMLRQHPVRSWTLVDELGVGHSIRLSINDFFLRLACSVWRRPLDEQPEVLWEKDR